MYEVTKKGIRRLGNENIEPFINDALERGQDPGVLRCFKGKVLS